MTFEAMMAEWYQDGKALLPGMHPDDDNPPAEGDDCLLMRTSAVFHTGLAELLRLCAPLGGYRQNYRNR